MHALWGMAPEQAGAQRAAHGCGLEFGCTVASRRLQSTVGYSLDKLGGKMGPHQKDKQHRLESCQQTLGVRPVAGLGQSMAGQRQVRHLCPTGVT